MEKILLILLSMLLTSCDNKKLPGSLEQMSLKETEKEAIKGLQERFSNEIQTRANGENDPLGLYQILKTVEPSSLTTIEYYEFDKEDFYKAPSPENLIECLKPSDEAVIFMEKNNKGEDFRLDAVKRDGVWMIGKFGKDWQKNSPWFAEKEKASGTTFKMFKFYAYDYFMLEENGKISIYDGVGREQDLHRLTESFVDKMNRIKQRTSTSV